MLARNNKNDGDDNVNIDVVQGISEVESEEKDQINISKNRCFIIRQEKNYRIGALGRKKQMSWKENFFKQEISKRKKS